MYIDVSACVADIAFVVDNSGSIRDNDPPGGNNWQLILDFVKSIVDFYLISADVTRVAVVDFGWLHRRRLLYSSIIFYYDDYIYRNVML